MGSRYRNCHPTICPKGATHTSPGQRPGNLVSGLIARMRVGAQKQFDIAHALHEPIDSRLLVIEQ